MRTKTPLRTFRFAVLSVVALALLVFAGAAEAATRTVTVSSNRFTDAVSGNSTSTIAAGDTIMWNWSSGTHTSTSGSCSGGCTPNGTWDSGIKSSGSFPFTFPTAGTFTYYCEVHGAMMQGTVIVQSTGTAPVANFTFTPPAPQIGNSVTFTDTSTGSPTSWSWNFGDPASGGSNTSTAQGPTHAFQSAGTFTVSLQATNASGSNTTTKNVTVSNGGPLVCVEDNETMCLNNGRFAVTAEWTKPDTTSGHGNKVRLTGDSGYFWFFDPANIEMVIKVLNGCAIEGHSYWVFAAGLTNVKVELKVVDTTTGAVYQKENPLNTAFIPIQDTSAFPASCP
jgi:plastocyanin